VLDAAAVVESELPGSRDRRIQAALERYFTDPVTVRHSDLPKTGAGRRALLLWGRLLGQFEVARLVVEHQSIELAQASPPDAASSAVAQVDVVLEARQRGQRLSERRSVALGLVQRGGEWRIESIFVAQRSSEQPEARP
jgi:hypothetical protein